MNNGLKYFVRTINNNKTDFFVNDATCSYINKPLLRKNYRSKTFMFRSASNFNDDSYNRTGYVMVTCLKFVLSL